MRSLIRRTSLLFIAFILSGCIAISDDLVTDEDEQNSGQQDNSGDETGGDGQTTDNGNDDTTDTNGDGQTTDNGNNGNTDDSGDGQTTDSGNDDGSTDGDDQTADNGSQDQGTGDDTGNSDGQSGNSDDSTNTDDSGSSDDQTAGNSLRRSTMTPVIADIGEVRLVRQNNLVMTVAPALVNADHLNGSVHWTKSYGPDGVTVHPLTGEVRWEIADDMPSESFHIGIKANGRNNSTSASFIAHVGIDNVVYVGANETYSSIKLALRAIDSGDTVVVRDGTYTGDSNFIGLTLGGSIQHPPSGNSSNFTTIMAEHPGKTTLTDGAYIRLHGYWNVSYVAFKGFFVDGGQLAVFGYGRDSQSDTRRHSHIKFIRNGATGSEHQSPFDAFRCDDILFENNYAFGSGRYKISSYQAERIVWRRNVARYDRGTHEGEPKGTYAIYTTMDAYLSNNIAIDGTTHEFTTRGELAGEFTTPTTSGHTRARFERSMQINSTFLFGNADEQLSGGGGNSDVEYIDMVSWDVRPASRYVMTWGSALYNHMTMGEIEPRERADHFFFGYHNNSRGVINSVLHNLKNGDMFYSLEKENDVMVIDHLLDRYGVDTVNITGFDGTLNLYNTDIENITAFNPMHSDSNPNGGIRYLTRSEESSNLSDKALDGGNLGATVMTFKGKSGTFFGDPGYDEETHIPMWPFPMEDVIKEKYSQYSYTGPTYTGHYTDRVENGVGTIEGARGFAVDGQTLTNYIWGYLGHTVPPFNVSATVVGENVIVNWNANPNEGHNDISAFKVYLYSVETGAKTLVTQVDSTHFRHTITGLQNDSTHNIVVTAVGAAGESGYSYVATAVLGNPTP